MEKPMSNSEKNKNVPTDRALPIQSAPEAIGKVVTSEDDCLPVAPAQESPAMDTGLDHDPRFEASEWQRWPYNLIYRNYLLAQRFWLDAAREIDGLSGRDEQVVSSVMRQAFDMMSPSNMPWTNPEVITRTVEEGGVNLIRGAQNMAEDWERAISGKPPVGAEEYLPGRDVAVTPGKVVFRSHLLELIQYAPQTDTILSEPILIVPAWMMKYYILDLSPHNSLVRYLVERGFTVFMISWRNPDATDRDLGIEDYIDAVTEALDAVAGIVPDTSIHAIGYCLGGTLLSVKAAQMARDHDDRLKTLALFAARTDFEDPGELGLLIGGHNVSWLEHSMSKKGYLDTGHLATMLKMLRSNDFVWPSYISDYLIGERQRLSDILAWSTDATRMPYRMFSEYLNRIILGNALAQGRYEVKGKPVTIADISVPMFCVATTDDHISPWKSVYKLHVLADTELTFVLTSGGHVDGIVMDPSDDAPIYQIATAPDAVTCIAPEDWCLQSPVKSGSWWPELVTWLRDHSSVTTKPPCMGDASYRDTRSDDAPGSYVFQR